MSQSDFIYMSLARPLLKALDENKRNNRTDTPTGAIFGAMLRFDLSKEFPLLTTKQVHLPSVVSELLWFLKGDTNIKYLLEHNNHIWTDWRYKAYLQDHAKRTTLNSPEPLSMSEFESLVLNDPTIAEAYGNIGKGYGHQWRNFGELPELRPYSKDVKYQDGFDQISWVINEIKTNPNSRRLIVSGWNPHEVDQVDLPPCHTLFQFFVEPMTLNERKHWVDKNYVGGGKQAIKDHVKACPNMYPIASSDEDYREHHINVCDFAKAPKSKLSCQLYQRSADYFLGVPFNIASYALLTHLIARECGLDVGMFNWMGGDVHLYENHREAILQQESNLLNLKLFDAPELIINSDKSIFYLEPSDISINNYQHAGKIPAPVAV